MKRRGVIASDADAQGAAEAALLDGGSAVHAVVSGFFAAAALAPSVLLGPVAVLSGGVGRGFRAFDGRPHEPGVDARRPRGIRQGELSPEAAHLAAPGSLAALSLAVLYHGGTLLQAARAGIALARRAGALERADTLETLARMGAPGLRHPPIQRALLEAGGPAAGGNLSPADLDSRFTADFEAATSEPWLAVFPRGTSPRPGRGLEHAIVAADGSGLLAGLTYWVDADAPVIEGLGVSLPRLATPVRRGVPRPRPGTRIEVATELVFEGSPGAPERVRVSSYQGPRELRQDPRTKEVSVPAR